MSEGYILWYRQFLDNPFLNKKPFCKGYAWLVLVSLTNCKLGYVPNKNGQQVKVFRGECGYTRKALANIFGWSRGKLERYLCELEEQKMITCEHRLGRNIIKVLGYDFFQKRTANGHKNGHTNEALKKQKTEQQKKSVDTDIVCISKKELEEIIQQKIKETDIQTDTKTNINKEYNSNTSYINISSSSSIENFPKITEEEEELLKNHSKRNKIRYFKPWLRKILTNGDYLDILKLEKAKQAKAEEVKKEKEQVPEESSPEEIEQIKKIQERIKKKGKERQ